MVKDDNEEELNGVQIVAADVRRRLESALMNESERDVKTRALFEDVIAPIDDCALPHLTPEMRQCRYYFQVGDARKPLEQLGP